MRFIHLSDLHIGKRVNGFSMLEDQRFILEQILGIIQQEKPDGVLIAGDLYDKPAPSAEAVSLFDDFLTGLANLAVPVLAVCGNHDSAERIAFGSRIFRERGVHFSPVYDGHAERILFEDSYGPAAVWLLPHVKPAIMRRALADESIESYEDAVRAALARIRPDPSIRNVLVAHQFVTGAVRCESEEILVGGMDNVSVSLFDGFDYVALGHIHSPQSAGRENVRYCGSPLKYSFSEAEQTKSVTVVELRGKGEVRLETIPLVPLRDMRRIRGSYLEVTARSFYQHTNVEDYLQVTLTDEQDVPDALAKLRVIYPNLMRLEYDNARTRSSQSIGGTGAEEEKSELERFGDFYELQNNQPFSGEQEAFVRELLLSLTERADARGQ